MFRFWYRFVGPNINLIVVGNGELIYDQKVAQNLNAFMGFVFEQIAQEYLMNQLIQNKLPFAFLKIGRWWGNNALAKREEEIDILAYDSQKAIFGEYTWSDNEVGLMFLMIYLLNQHYLILLRIISLYSPRRHLVKVAKK